jgi:glycosyltransferase involved in cell wall biosynthesis
VANILIDVTRLLDRALQGHLATGVDRVSLEYTRHFKQRARALVRYGGRWIALGQSDSIRVFDALLQPCQGFGRLVRWSVVKNYVLSGKRPLVSGVLINTGHSGPDLPGYADQVKQLGMRPLFFLHDLIPITHPEYCRPGESEKHRHRLATMLSVGRGLIVNSLATWQALASYASQTGQTLPPSVIAPLAPARLPKPESRPLLEAPYFVMLGTIEPRKNHWMILHLWRELADQYGSAAPRLVVIGRRGWECEQVVDLLDRCEALRALVIEKPRCEDGELATWLVHARALLFPSFIEGFGIPLIEALMFGVPVIASDLPVFHEIAGGIPEYLSPLDGEGWKHAIMDYAQRESRSHAAQRERMKDYQPPTWEEHMRKVEGLIEAVTGEAGS